MKRAHRRSHLFMWLAIAPATALVALWALMTRAPDVTADLTQPLADAIASEAP